jgi:hypothetical protein
LYGWHSKAVQMNAIVTISEEKTLIDTGILQNLTEALGRLAETHDNLEDLDNEIGQAVDRL